MGFWVGAVLGFFVGCVVGGFLVWLFGDDDEFDRPLSSVL